MIKESIIENLNLKRATRSQNKRGTENSQLIGEVFSNEVFSNYTGKNDKSITNCYHIKV